eukprot:422125_1
MATKWEKIHSFPRRLMSNLIGLNNHDIICAAPNVFGKQSNGIYKFNKYLNKWILFIQYPNNFVSTGHTLCLNNITNELFLYGSEGKLMKINLNTHEFIIITDLPSFGSYPPTIIISNNFHIICGSKNNKHLLWNNNTSKFQALHSFNKILNKSNNELYGQTLVYIPSQKALLLFGGGSSNLYRKWIWKYSLNNNSWGKIAMRLPYSFFKTACILTKDEKYIIMLGGGISDYGNLRYIHVMNLNTMLIQRSNVNLPTRNPVHVGLIKNMNIPYLVNGFMKMFYNTCANEIYKRFPLELIRCIMTWVGQEIWCIHVVDRITSEHWKIGVNSILNNVY